MEPTPLDDYYALLEVPRDVGAAELRRAFRKLALRHHPDRAGVESTRTFQRLALAYEVLSDPEARVKYDRRLGYAERQRAQPPSAARAAAPSPAGREAHAPAVPTARAPKVLLSRVCGPLDSLIGRGLARRGEDGVIELRLSEAESAQGGWATISTYAPISCMDCRGPAGSQPHCPRCKGEGTVLELVSAWLTIPPHVSNGTVLSVDVDPRMRTAPLQFRIRTSSAPISKG